MYKTRHLVHIALDPGVVAALKLWAAADNRSLTRQVEFILLRALYRRGIDPCDFTAAAVGTVFPSGGEPYNLADYLVLVDKRRAHRRSPGFPPDEPSGGSPTAGDRSAGV